MGDRGAIAKSRLEAGVARDAKSNAQALWLRHRVFAGKAGTYLPSAAALIDDERCGWAREHLIVREVASGDVVAACPILSPGRARDAGGYWAERQFDLGLLALLRERMVEVGRALIDPRYRFASVMPLLWSAMANYLIDNRHDYVLGSASITLADGGHSAASIYRAACERCMSPDDCRVFPRRALPLESLCDTRLVGPPPLLRSYFDLGAWLCGAPGVNAELGCAELPILLPLARMHRRYARHFLQQAA